MYVCLRKSKHDSVEGVHSIQLKFDMNITGHRRTNPMDFAECRMHNFFTGVKKKYLMYYAIMNKIF